MSIESRIISAVGNLVNDQIELNLYKGTALEYIEFTYDVSGDVFADSKPGVLRYEINLTWCLPHGINPRTRRKQISAAINEAGFTFPSVTNASDEDGQRYEFYFEGVDGDSNGTD